jgi:LysM repeat protein
MRTFRMRALLSCLAVLFLATGCFQQAGSAQQSTAVSQALPSPTPIPPSDTPEPLPTEEPTDEPTDVPVVEPTEPALPLPTDTADGLSAQDLLSTPAASPTSVLEVAQAEEPDNPLDLTATAIVLNATATQYAIQTATAISLFGTPIPTATVPPTVGPGITPTTAGPVAPGANCVHEVRAGENLFRISLTYGLLVNDIAQASGIVNPNVISVGQMLTIPGCGTTGARPPATSTPGGVVGGTPVPGGSTGGTSYVIQQGDTLFALSLRFGVPVNSIAAANGISNINVIYMGQTLTIPAS